MATKKKAPKGAKNRNESRANYRTDRKATRDMALSGKLKGVKVKGGRGVMQHTTTRGDTGRRISVYTKNGKLMRKTKGGFVEGGGDE